MRPGHWMAIDFAVASFLALCCLFAGYRADGPGQVPATLVFAGVIFLAVGLRRRGPAAAFGVLGFVVAIDALAPMTAIDTIALIAMAYVLYLVTVTSSRLTGFLTLAAGLAELAGIAIAIHYRGVLDGQLPGTAGTFEMIIAWMTGYSVRQRRAYVETMQVQAASSAVAEERLRIARELHDVVAHSMSVIAVQAGFGQYVIDTSPADAREALGAISVTSREALAELRRMLGVLRQEGALSTAPLTPECGLAELDRLVERTRGAGIDVRLARAGTARELPAGIDVSAYRIVQESLTNVVKHAGSGARCTVLVGFTLDELAIEVANDGGRGVRHPHSPGSWHGSGHGIVGMRERASLCGGELSAGPLPDGGFRVLARLPIPASTPLAMPVSWDTPPPPAPYPPDPAPPAAPHALELVP